MVAEQMSVAQESVDLSLGERLISALNIEIP